MTKLISHLLYSNPQQAVSGLTMQLEDEKKEEEDSDGDKDKAEAGDGAGPEGGKEALIPLPDEERAGQLQRWQDQEQRRYRQQIRRRRQRQTARREYYQEQEQLQGRERPPSASASSILTEPAESDRGASHEAAKTLAARSGTLPPRGPRVARTKRTVLEVRMVCVDG